MNEIEKLNLTRAYTQPLLAFCSELISNSDIDLAIAIEQMQPNISVRALGMIVFLLHCGLIPDQITQRFVDNSK